MHNAYLGLGSNLGDREQYIATAIQKLSAFGEVIAVAENYETKPFGILDQPDFLNTAIHLETHLEPEALLSEILKIEKELGRERKEKNGPRTIDIDIILFDDVILETPSLQVPHLHFLKRISVLDPLCEIAPYAIDPISQKTISALKKQA